MTMGLGAMALDEVAGNAHVMWQKKDGAQKDQPSWVCVSSLPHTIYSGNGIWGSYLTSLNFSFV